jgi:glycosyltransferase involved in cell wall biosynthesis
MNIDVLHVLPDFGVGGAEHIAVHLLQETDARRFTTAALCLGPRRGTALEETLARCGTPVTYLDKRKGFSPRCATAVHRFVREHAVRIVHTHRHVLHYVLPALSVVRGLRCVHTVHNLAEREVPGPARLAHRLAFRVGAVPVAISHAVKRSLQRVYRLPHVPVVPNGIPVKKYQNAGLLRDHARAALHLPEDAVVFGCFARLAPQKNHAGLLDAFVQGPGRDPRAHLLLVGDGPLGAELRAQAQAAGLERVQFLGEQADVVPLLAATDVVVLASSWEGSPLAIMEGLAAGRAVVATAVGGVPELIQAGRTGFLVPPASPRALAHALQRVFLDAALREELGRAGALWAGQRFDCRVMAQRYQSLYDALLAGKRLVPAGAAT